MLSPSNQRKFGNEVRRLRQQAGFTQAQLAYEIPLSQSMLSGIEGGTKGAKTQHITRIDEALNTDGKLLRLWESLSSSRGIQHWAIDAIRLEKAAAEIREYQIAAIPGLLQEEGYAHATLRDGQPDLTDDEIDEQVKARLDRRAVLHADSRPRYRVVLDESVVRRPIGGREIMGQQLDHLLKLSAAPNVVIQILPMETENHPALTEAFKVFTVRDRGEILYLETRISGTPIDHPDSVRHYTRLFEDLRGAALSASASRGLLQTIRGEFQ